MPHRVRHFASNSPPEGTWRRRSRSTPSRTSQDTTSNAVSDISRVSGPALHADAAQVEAADVRARVAAAGKVPADVRPLDLHAPGVGPVDDDLVQADRAVPGEVHGADGDPRRRARPGDVGRRALLEIGLGRPQGERGAGGGEREHDENGTHATHPVILPPVSGEAGLAYARAVPPSKPEPVVLDVAGREVTVTNPGKVYFPEAGITKLDVVRYYLAVAEGALRGAGGRPNVLVRYANGIHGEFFYQKRAPDSRPEWIEVVALSFPSGRTAEEVVPRDAAALAWMANLGCLELHPHPVRAEDLDHPDELRVDLDPVPGRGVAAAAGDGAASSTRCWTSSASSAGPRRRARAAST